MPMKKKEEKDEKKAKKTVSKSASSKAAKEKHVAKASKPVKHSKPAKEKPAKKTEETSTTPVVETKASENELMPKVQCYNHGKKTICAHLILATHKCTAKRIAPDRLATVRIGKKRRCEFYEETTFSK